MFDKPNEWLKKYWWGIIVAYGLVCGSIYLFVLSFADPLGIPNNLNNFPLITSRNFALLILAFFIGSHITLALDIFLRRSTWTNNSNALSEILKSRRELTDRHNELIKAIRRVSDLQGDYRTNDWKVLHSIDESGNDFLEEELTIAPFGESVYLYFKGYKLEEVDGRSAIELSAKNLYDGTPLSVLELERTPQKAYFAILLDPPSTASSPKRIGLKCKRLGLWSKLLANSRDEGVFRPTNESNSIELVIVAPRGKKWAGFHPAPTEGDFKIETTNPHSRIIWNIKNARPKRYAYEVFVEQSF